MNFDKRLTLNNFQNSTTYNNDYKPYSPRMRKKYRWPKDQIEKPRKSPEKYNEHDIETFQLFRKDHHVPFNLLWQPRPIVETDPRTPYPKSLKEVEDTGKEEAIKTRPRLYMSPGISMDDVPEEEMRNMICKNVYQTEWRRAEEEVWKYLKKTKRSVFDSILDAGRKIEVKPDLYPPLPDGWKEHCVKWDNQQKRALVDPTKEFWLNKDMIPKEEGNPFEKIIPKEMKTEISDLIEDEKLRLPHDKIKPGYAGYQPKLSMGVSLAKSDFPVTHPLLSVSEVIATRWKYG